MIDEGNRPCAARAVLRQCLARLGDALPDRTSDEHAPPVTLGDVVLLPHQVEGARRLRAILGTHGGALLADDVGLGKTYTALQVARGTQTVLVVVPATLREMWIAACRRGGIVASIASYEGLSAGRIPPGSPWALVILDEAHHARSPATRRYRLLADLTRGAQVLLISATPIHNRRGDLDALLALFLGEAAAKLDAATLAALVVRRRVHHIPHHYPALSALVRHVVPPAAGVLAALRALPPPLPPADGSVAQALVTLQLTRAWCSSDAALLSALRARLTAAVALESALTCGRLPTRSELSAWTGGIDGSVQLAFPELVAAPAPSTTLDGIGRALDIVRAHAAALRAIRTRVRGAGARDAARFATLARVIAEHPARQVVVFTHSAETAEHAFAALRHRFRVALLTGRGAALASGPVDRRDVLTAFAPSPAGGTVGRSSLRASDVARIDVLVATDVMSEGVDLHRAAVVIHLDLPWTMARLEQRVGRLRRLGSSHAQVSAHLITPPADAEELESTLFHLRRKAMLVTGTMGASSVLGDTAGWPGLATGRLGTAPALARDTMIDALRRLEKIAHVCAGEHPSDVDFSPAGDAVLAARWRVPWVDAPRAFALVCMDGTAHLLLSDCRGITLDPETVVAALDGAPTRSSPPADSTDVARTQASMPAGSADFSRDATALEEAVRLWCANRAAESDVSLPASNRSSAHRRLLHALGALVARAPRASRRALAIRATDGRRFVLAHRGSGAERLLASLANACPLASAGPVADNRWLDTLVTTLQPFPPALAPAAPPPTAQLTCSSGGVRLEAVLTVMPANPGGGAILPPCLRSLTNHDARDGTPSSCSTWTGR